MAPIRELLQTVVLLPKALVDPFCALCHEYRKLVFASW